MIDTKIDKVNTRWNVFLDPIHFIEVSVRGTQIVNFYLRVVEGTLSNQNGQIILLRTDYGSLDSSLALQRPFKFEDSPSVFFPFSNHRMLSKRVPHDEENTVHQGTRNHPY